MLQLDHDSAVGFAELHRVGNKVPDNLLEPLPVPLHHHLRRREPRNHLHASRFGRRPDGVERRLYHRSERHGRRIQVQPPGDDARDVEEVGNELRLQLCVAVDHLERAPRAAGIEHALHHHPRPADDSVERRAQLVRQRGEEIVFGAIGGLCLLARNRHGLLFALARDELSHLMPDRRHRAKQILVPRHDRSVEAVDHAEDFPAEANGKAERRVQAGFTRHGGTREVRVVGDVVDPGDRPGRQHPAGQPDARGKACFARHPLERRSRHRRGVPLRDAAQPLILRIEQPEARDLPVEVAADAGQDRWCGRGQIGRASEHFANGEGRRAAPLTGFALRDGGREEKPRAGEYAGEDL